MATSGSFNTATYTTGGKTRYLTFSWERTSYSVDKNTSTISYTLKGNGTYTGWINTRNIKLVINGTTVYTATGPIKVYNGTVLKSGTITISHNSDGTKSFSASAEAGIYYSTINSTGSGSFTLNTIPRKSTVTATNGNIGSTSTITITRASSSFTHTLTWSCSGLSGTFATKTTATSVKPTIPTSIYAKIPNAKTATVTVTCETFNGSTSLGTNTCTFTATASESVCKPTLTYTSILDTNATTKAVTGDNKTFIKGVSNAQISGVVATGNNSATIKSIVFKCDTKSANVSNGTATISAVTSGTFSLVATDSRGYSTTVPYTATMYDYFKPTLAVKVQRVEQTGSIVKAEYSGKFCNNAISKGLTLDYRYIKDDGNYSDWANITSISANSGNDYSGSVTFDIEFDYRKDYPFEFRAVDCLNSTPYKDTLFRGVPIFDWGEDDFNFNVPLHYQDKPMAFVVEYGTKNITDPNTNQTITWNYRKWENGTAECWIRRVVNVKVTSTWGSSLFYGTVSTINFPFQFAEVPVVNVTCEYGDDEKSLFIASCGFSSQNYARPIMLCRPEALTVNCVLLYQVIGRWK